MDVKLSSEDKGILRTHISGGGMAKRDIAQFNEDADDTCDYCRNEVSTSPHTIWACSFFKDLRLSTDPELAKVPLKYLVYCIQRGIAPAMRTDGKRTYWGLDFDGETSEEVKVLLG